VHVEVARPPVDALGAHPAEEDVARRLHEALALDHAPARVGPLAGAGVRREHRGAGLLGLEEERVAVVAAEEQEHPGAPPTLPAPTTLRAAWT
jgi:hypothetical protein